jgi:hypothetical protein
MDMKMDIKEDFEGKLKDYYEIRPQDVRKGMHLRVTSTKYREKGRKIGYIVVKSVDEEGNFVCNSYKPIYPDWCIKPSNKWKAYRFYKKNDRVWTGDCLDCQGTVDEGYFVCYDCMMKRKGETV